MLCFFGVKISIWICDDLIGGSESLFGLVCNLLALVWGDLRFVLSDDLWFVEDTVGADRSFDLVAVHVVSVVSLPLLRCGGGFSLSLCPGHAFPSLSCLLVSALISFWIA
ncbi:unnamed protein product, partial [Arabidopsis halleri]